MNNKIDICYLCGKELGKDIDVDHVPPKQFYARSIRKNVSLQLSTFPTHKSCNKSYQKDEDYFLHSVGPLAMESHTGKELWADIRSQLKRPEGQRIIKMIYEEFEERPSGLILPHGKIMKSFNGKRIRSVIWKITSGLYYKEYNKYLPESTTHLIEIYGHGEKIRDEFSIVRDTPSRGKYKRVFDYKYVGTEKYNLFAMLFWETIISLIVFEEPKEKSPV